MTEGRFETSRTILRGLEAADAERLQAYLNAPTMIGCRYVPWRIPDIAPLSRTQVEGILEAWSKEKKGFALGITLRETGELVGHGECNWHWDTHCPGIGIAIAPDHQRRGLGSEVASRLIAHLFENTPAHNVSGWVASWNEAGLAFAKRLGFAESGRIPRSGIRDGTYVDAAMVDILRPEWAAAREGADGA